MCATGSGERQPEGRESILGGLAVASAGYGLRTRDAPLLASRIQPRIHSRENPISKACASGQWLLNTATQSNHKDDKQHTNPACHGASQSSAMGGFELCGTDYAKGPVQASLVVPVDLAGGEESLILRTPSWLCHPGEAA